MNDDFGGISTGISKGFEVGNQGTSSEKEWGTNKKWRESTIFI